MFSRYCHTAKFLSHIPIISVIWDHKILCLIEMVFSKIFRYLESKPQHWRPGHNIQVKEIEDVNKMKMGLYVTHTINFQNAGDRNSRRSELVLELKKIFQELSIKYHLLPQEVHLRYVGSAPPAFQP